MDGAPSKPQPLRRLDYESYSLLMRPSHPFFESPYFQFTDLQTLFRSLGADIAESERQEIARLAELKLPPISSRLMLAALIGVSPGLIWSFCKRTRRHYRVFDIAKGSKVRTITAPRVALKIVQKWISIQIQKHYVPPEHVYGFVPGKSHVDAATKHCSAEWLLGVDIQNFFQTTPQRAVEAAFREIGYGVQGAELLSQLTCISGFLAQGSPASPVMSNICLKAIDSQLQTLASENGLRLTRYADDIVFSGIGSMPEDLLSNITQIFSNSPWTLAQEKTEVLHVPERLKVHGLLVHGETVRLTKGYRNRLRAYAHLVAKGQIETNSTKILGHLQYGRSISKKSNRDNF